MEAFQLLLRPKQFQTIKTMNKQEIERQIVTKIISHYQNFDKAVLGITGYTLAEATGFSFPLQYFKDNLVLNLPPNLSISDEIKLLLSLMFKEGKKTNKGTFTIYPSGEYESSFIWDEEAHLESLKQNVRLWFIYHFEQASLRFVDKCDQSGIEWDFEANIIISFTAGKSNPVLFIVPKHPEMNFKLHLDQLHHYIEGDYTSEFEDCSITRVTDTYQASLVVANEETYNLINEGELKGYFPRWNRAIAILTPDKDISFEDIKFEWIEGNA